MRFNYVRGGAKVPESLELFQQPRICLNNYALARAGGGSPRLKTAMIMSEKTKPDEESTVSAVQTPEQVPEWLGNRLRRMFDDVMEEPVPDEFKALLKQLEDKERGS